MLHFDYFFRRRRTNLKEWVRVRGYRQAGAVQDALTDIGVEPPSKEILDKVISEIYPKPTLAPKPEPKKRAATNSRKTRTKRTKKAAP